MRCCVVCRTEPLGRTGAQRPRPRPSRPEHSRTRTSPRRRAAREIGAPRPDRHRTPESPRPPLGPWACPRPATTCGRDSPCAAPQWRTFAPSCPLPSTPIGAPGSISAGSLPVSSERTWTRFAPRETRAASRAAPDRDSPEWPPPAAPRCCAPALPIASVPTGTPPGICTIDSSESMPFKRVALHRHAQHRQQRIRRHHARQMRRAARAGDDHFQPARLGA